MSLSRFSLALLVMAVAALLTACPEPKVETPKVAGVKADAELHDFGTIIQGEVVEKVFTITNTGEATLELGKPKTTCGCTATILSMDKVAPGQTTQLKVKFNSTGKKGAQNRRILVPTNAPTRQQMEFTMQGYVKVDLEFSPNYVHLGKMTVAKPTTQNVDILNHSDKPVTITSFKLTREEELSITLKEKTVIPPGGKATFAVTAKPKDPSRHFSSRLQVECDHPQQASLYLSMYGQVADKNGEIPQGGGNSFNPPGNPGLGGVMKNVPIMAPNTQFKAQTLQRAVKPLQPQTNGLKRAPVKGMDGAGPAKSGSKDNARP